MSKVGNQIIECAVLSSLAYRSGAEGDSMWADELPNRLPANFTLIDVFDQSGMQGYLVRRHDNTQYLVFRGTDTDNLTDIFTVFSTDTKKIKSAALQVHGGFLDAWHALRRSAMRQLNVDWPIVTTGHSLGGAMAYLAAFDLHDTHNVRSIVTFGAPRVGNAVFTKRYNRLLGSRTTRVVNGADKIPRVWRQWWQKMLHPGKRLCFIDHAGKATINPHPLAVAWTRAGLLGWSAINFILMRWSHAAVGIRDHSMSEYLRLLKGNVQ